MKIFKVNKISEKIILIHLEKGCYYNKLKIFTFCMVQEKTKAKWKLGRACFHSYQAADTLIENNNDNNNNDKNQLHVFPSTSLGI